jgi:hypothetical protein
VVKNYKYLWCKNRRENLLNLAEVDPAGDAGWLPDDALQLVVTASASAMRRRCRAAKRRILASILHDPLNHAPPQLPYPLNLLVPYFELAKQHEGGMWESGRRWDARNQEFSPRRHMLP